MAKGPAACPGKSLAGPPALGHCREMPFLPVLPDDHDAVVAAVDLLNTASAVDDPDGIPLDVPTYRGQIRYGWDLNPGQRLLFVPAGERAPVGLLGVEMPIRDNLNLAWIELTILPGRRREGLGSELVAEAVRRTREAGRTTIWAGGPEDAPYTAGFLEHHGFHYASHDARRRQLLADVDRAELERLRLDALAAAEDYELERLVPPQPEELLAEIAVVAEAINDAPMGELTFEREVMDLQRMHDQEEARVGRGERHYRVVARHRATGELAGHTVMGVHPSRPRWGEQGDTAVARQHRGHRLGLLLKLDMLRWLEQVEPQLEEIETWNQADNDPMIRVNEVLGYRLNRVFATYERTLPA